VGRVAFASLLIAVRPGWASEPGYGLVIESVTPNTAAALSGFQPGDLLLSWTFRPHDSIGGRPLQTGTLDTCFDLVDLFIEKEPRGKLTFAGWRQGRALSWTVHSTGSLEHGFQVRPMMDLVPREHARHKVCAAVAAQEPPSPNLICESVPTGTPRRAACHRLHSAGIAVSVGDPKAADQAFEEAYEILLRASDPSARAHVLRAWAGYLIARRETARARELLGEALALERQRDGAGLSVAYTIGFLAYLADVEGDLASAERAWLERLTLLGKLVPEGLEVARALDWLGYLALWRGDTATAQERLSRSEAIQRLISINSLLYAATLTKLALVAQNLGDLERAEALQRQVLALNEQLVPGSQDHGGSLMNLAMTLSMRGELALAEDLLRRSVGLIDKPAIDPSSTAGPHFNLGMLALYRGDLAAAQSYFELALGRLQDGPESVELAGVYTEVARVARKQRRFSEARAWEKRALAIYEHLTLGSLGRAARLQALARIELEGGGDLATAEALLRQAEAIVLEIAPDGSPANPIRRD
jgi:tetratricopeptide (TPR) repeat protein